MHAKKYKIGIHRSALDLAQGVHATIEGIYIPKRRICVNFAAHS